MKNRIIAFTCLIVVVVLFGSCGAEESTSFVTIKMVANNTPIQKCKLTLYDVDTGAFEDSLWTDNLGRIETRLNFKDYRFLAEFEGQTYEGTFTVKKEPEQLVTLDFSPAPRFSISIALIAVIIVFIFLAVLVWKLFHR